MTSEALLKIANPKKVTLEQIEAYQKQKHIDFTPEYVEFLLKYNGILEFSGGAKMNGEGMSVDVLHPLDDRYDIWEGNEEDQYGFKHYIIGEISTGDWIIQISEEGEHFGKIMYWDHEMAFYGDAIEKALELDEKPAKEAHLSLLMTFPKTKYYRWPWFYQAPNLNAFLEALIYKAL